MHDKTGSFFSISSGGVFPVFCGGDPHGDGDPTPRLCGGFLRAGGGVLWVAEG